MWEKKNVEKRNIVGNISYLNILVKSLYIYFIIEKIQKLIQLGDDKRIERNNKYIPRSILNLCVQT